MSQLGKLFAALMKLCENAAVWFKKKFYFNIQNPNTNTIYITN